MASTWSWIGKRKQREIISMCINHVDKVIDVALATKEMIEKYSNSLFDEAKEKYNIAFEKEREADTVKRDIIAELSKGIFHPADREDLLRLTLKSDDVAAYLKAACRRILLLSIIIPKDICDMLITIASKIYEATKLIKDGVIELYENPKRTLEIADSIERLEEEVDDIRIKALEKVLEWCNSVKTAPCIIVKEVLDSLENAMDSCEDVADVLRSIAVLTL